ncbi:MAG: hypothetical protein ACFB0D_03415 [Phormidesmis sp.]
MSVVSGRKVVFCEGKRASLDYQLLNGVIAEGTGDEVTIVPSGSKFTFSVFAQGYFSPNDVADQRYLVFRDRDFDLNPTSEVKLLPLRPELSSNSVFLTHRACVENYLLAPMLIHAYWQEKCKEKRENPVSRWGHKASPGVEQLNQWIESSANELKHYQAVRWALGDLIQASSSRQQLKTTWTGGSGKLPRMLDSISCRNEAAVMVDSFRQAVSTVTLESFNESLEKYETLFAQERFWTERQYLIWFHGKDLQKEMQKQEPSYISLANYFMWAANEIDITQHSDLIELRERIKQL